MMTWPLWSHSRAWRTAVACLGVIWLLLASSPALARPAPLVLSNADGEFSPLPHLEVLDDTTGSLTFEQVHTAYANRFRQAPEGLGAHGTPHATHWARFTVHREIADVATWWLKVRADSVTVFLPQPDGPPIVSHTGFLVPVEKRSVQRGFPVAAELRLPLGRDQLIYLRIRHQHDTYRTGSTPTVPRLEAASFARDALTGRDYFQGAFFGVMLALGVYNLFLYFTIRSRPYLYYVLVTLFWALYWMTGLGYHIDFGWPADMPGAYEVNFFVMLGIPIFHVLFTQHFLNTRQLVPGLHHTLTAILVGCLAAGLLAAAGVWDAAEFLAASLALVFAPVVITVAVLVYRSGYTPARYYLLACAALSVGVVLYTLRWFGILPETGLTLYSLQIGVVLEAVLFSLALADRIRLLERERNQALEQKTRAEALTRALRETDELKTQLLGLAAHDLRSPLTNIMGFTEMMNDQWPDQAPREPLHAIRNAAQRMSALLNDLLNTTAIESGAISFSPHPVDLARITEGVTDAYQHQAAQKQQSLSIDLPNATTMVNADEERLREALDNLISNAVKYTPHGGTITVHVQRHDGSARVIVQDSGPGLSQEDQQHLFKRFKRLSTRPTGNEPSTGLGLAITKHIIDLHDGKIWAESAPDEGTTFIIELALIRVPVPSAA